MLSVRVSYKQYSSSTWTAWFVPTENTVQISMFLLVHWLILTLYSPVVTICTTSLTFSNSTFCPHSVFICFVWISEQTAIISLYNINGLVCITETECLLRGTDWMYICIYIYIYIYIVTWIKGQRISWLDHLERMEEDRMPKISSLKNWRGRDEGEDPGKDGKKKKKEIFKCWEWEDGES